MKRAQLVLGSLFIFSAVLLGQGNPKVQVISPMPYGNMKKLYEISKPKFVYNGQYKSLDEIDLKNSVIHAFFKNRHGICGKLRAGYWESREEGGIDSLRLLESHRMPWAEGNSRFLLVIVEQSSVYGSSESDHYAQVWMLRDGKLSIEQQISYNTHFSDSGSFEKYSAKDNLLRVRSSHYLAHDAHCCISAYDELTFRWTGSEYALTRIETKLLPDTSDAASRSERK